MGTDSINKNHHSKVQVHPLRGGVLVLIFEWFWMYRKRTLICTVNVPFKIDWQEVRSFFLFENFKDDQVTTGDHSLPGFDGQVEIGRKYLGNLIGYQKWKGPERRMLIENQK
jgi:hypothetical protein